MFQKYFKLIILCRIYIAPDVLYFVELKVEKIKRCSAGYCWLTRGKILCTTCMEIKCHPLLPPSMTSRFLMFFSRWNKEVGYCQGFNMIAAIILEVMDKSESDSLKVNIK